MVCRKYKKKERQAVNIDVLLNLHLNRIEKVRSEAELDQVLPRQIFHCSADSSGSYVRLSDSICRSLKGGDPAAPSDTATLLRLHPSHWFYLRRLPPCG